MVTRRHLLSGAALATLSGCSGGISLNPFNWFSSDEDNIERLEEIDVRRAQDNRLLIPEVTSLSVEKLPGGIILRANGLPDQQGWYDAQLVPNDSDTPGDGNLTLEFRASPPAEPTRVSTVQSREIIAGIYLSDVQLVGIRVIRVLGSSQSRSTRI